MRLNPDTLLAGGKYRVVRHLGAGAGGDVYLVEHRTLGRQAMKRLARDDAGNPYSDVRRRFALEAMLGTRLRHPNLLEVYDHDEADGVAYLTMQYAENGTLADALRAGPLSVEDCVRWLRDASCGLQALHDAGVVHRDVKPSNLLILKDGQVVVADLGLAQTDDDHSRREGAGSAGMPHPGTPDYMSPEHLAPLPLHPTSDVYSLGCVAFELLTGSRYVQAQSRAAGPASLRADVPLWLDALVQRMLAPHPGVRPSDAADVQKRYVGMAPVVAELTSGLQRLQDEQRERQAAQHRAQDEARRNAEELADLRAQLAEAQRAQREVEQRLQQEAERRVEPGRNVLAAEAQPTSHESIATTKQNAESGASKPKSARKFAGARTFVAGIVVSLLIAGLAFRIGEISLSQNPVRTSLQTNTVLSPQATMTGNDIGQVPDAVVVSGERRAEVALTKVEPKPTANESQRAGAVLGKQIFVRAGCNSCHGVKEGEKIVGPTMYGIWKNAATRKPGVSPRDYLHESIVAPGAYVVEGYQDNIMPVNYGQTLKPEEIDAMLTYIQVEFNK